MKNQGRIALLGMIRFRKTIRRESKQRLRLIVDGVGVAKTVCANSKDFLIQAP
jgi:hypothetical protein